MRFSVFVGSTAILIGGFFVSLDAQIATSDSNAERKAFEVATVRQNRATTGPSNWERLPGGQFRATRLPLRNLIRLAYGQEWIWRVQQQMIGVPGWAESDRFDIEAKAAAEFAVDPDGQTREHFAMLRTLLEDRFKLRARVESRRLPIYALVRVNATSLGPRIAVSTVDCSPGAPPPAEGPTCGISNLGPGRGTSLRGYPLGALLTWLNLSPAVDRIVFDKTGLTGNYDIQLYFAPPFVFGPGMVAVPNPDVDSGPTVFTALQEQLGLRLEPRQEPVDVLVIDHVERLSEP